MLMFLREELRNHDADNATMEWGMEPIRRPKAGTGVRSARPKAGTGLRWGHWGHGVPGRRPALACTGAWGHGVPGRRPALACTGGTSECRAAGRRPALAGPKARHCGARLSSMRTLYILLYMLL